jgi:spermidine synthase
MAESPARGAQQTPPSTWSRLALLWLVFSSGVAVMGLEMSASRLIAPYFGTTLTVWTSLIGLVLLFLTLGYYLGGALADRLPTRVALGLIVLIAGLTALCLPLFSGAVLAAAWKLTPKLGILGGSFVGTFALFSLPMVLLGCVCPFAMKLSIMDLGRTGRTAGRIYAISAIGSVVGTFLPALVTIPIIGVHHSIMLFGAILVVAALLVLARLRFLPAACAVALFAVPLKPLLPVQGAIARRESPYNYLQVVQIPLEKGSFRRMLIVDWGGFSVYQPGAFRTDEYYDYLLMAPLLRERPPSEWLHRVLIIGLGAGTASKQITQCYGPVEIDGVEIDPAIVGLGRKLFEMNEPNLHVHVTDGRAFLAGAAELYDWVIVDAYQGSDIPFHLTTKEFFSLLREHMSPGGVLSINVAWWRPDDRELLDRLAATVGSAFPTVVLVPGISEQSGAVLLAGGEDASLGSIGINAAAVGHAGLAEIAAQLTGPEPPDAVAVQPGTLGLLTDDRAPVEEIADRMYRKRRRLAFERERAVLGL